MITDNYFTAWDGTSTRRVNHYLSIGSHYELMQPIKVNISGQAAQGSVVLLALWQTQALRETIGHDVSVDRQRTLHYACVVCRCVRVIKCAYPYVFVSNLFSWQFDQNDLMISLFVSFLSLGDSACVCVHACAQACVFVNKVQICFPDMQSQIKRKLACRPLQAAEQWSWPGWCAAEMGPLLLGHYDWHRLGTEGKVELLNVSPVVAQSNRSLRWLFSYLPLKKTQITILAAEKKKKIKK